MFAAAHRFLRFIKAATCRYRIALLSGNKCLFQRVNLEWLNNGDKLFIWQAS